ncbi:MAG: DnaA ATPase domain-containing protein [Phycisphaerales bacterium]
MTNARAQTTHAHPNPEDRILARLHHELGGSALDRYFPKQARLSLHDNHLDVTVPTGYLAEVISQKFGTTLQRAAEAESGSRDRSGRVRVNFHVDGAAFADAESRKPGEFADDATRTAPGTTPVSRVGQPGHARSGLRASPRRYRLDDFVVGPANEMAFAAAARAADLDQPMQGLLFLHGSCGLGKTHLLQGIEDRCRRRHPAARAVYTTAETFTNEFVAACRAGRVDTFRNTYRSVALLCIDDVQFLSSKAATQTELLHTLDALGQFGGRIVLASDEHPRQVRSFAAALVSRFLAGAVVSLRVPDAELRARIIAALAQRRGMVLGSGAIAAVATACDNGSVRDLEGALARVDAAQRLAGDSAPIGAIVVRRALESAAAGPARPVRGERIIAEVCRTLRVTDAELRGTGRHPRVVLARGLIVHLCRAMTTLSFPEIARAMGRPNHSSVVTSGKRFAALLARPEAPIAELSDDQTLAGTTLPGLCDVLRRDITQASGPQASASAR